MRAVGRNGGAAQKNRIPRQDPPESGDIWVARAGLHVRGVNSQLGFPGLAIINHAENVNRIVVVADVGLLEGRAGPADFGGQLLRCIFILVGNGRPVKVTLVI